MYFKVKVKKVQQKSVLEISIRKAKSVICLIIVKHG